MSLEVYRKFTQAYYRNKKPPKSAHRREVREMLMQQI